MPNAITMLKSDHATVKRLLQELSESGDRDVKQVKTAKAAPIGKAMRTGEEAR